MGFFDSLKKTFNISGAEVSLLPDSEIQLQADMVSGKVVIHGGQYDQEVRSVQVKLKEYWRKRRGVGKNRKKVTVYATRQTADLSGPTTVVANTESSYEFEFMLPLNARISTGSTGWLLSVELDIPMAIDPAGRLKLVVEPAEEFLAILEACETVLKFEENQSYRS